LALKETDRDVQAVHHILCILAWTIDGPKQL
jgi:hypothetical protein